MSNLRSSSSFNIQSIWSKFIDFETFVRRKDHDINRFIVEWEGKKDAAEAAGCGYPDLILALKLIERTNLHQDAVTSLLTVVGPMLEARDSVLLEVVMQLKKNCDKWQRTDDREVNYVSADDINEEDDNKQSLKNLDFLECDIKIKEDQDDDFYMSDGETVANKGSNNFPANYYLDNIFPEGSFVVVDSPPRQCLNCRGQLSEIRTVQYSDGDDERRLTVLNCPGCGVTILTGGVSDGKTGYIVLPQCSKCGQSLQPTAALMDSDQHNQSGGLECKLCRVFVHDKKLVANFFSHSSDRDERNSKNSKKAANGLDCLECDTVFSSLAELENHLTLHKPSALTCAVCNKKFLKQITLKRHMNHAHRDLKADVQADSELGLKSRPGKKSRLIYCPMCNKKFILQENLELHMTVHRSEDDCAKNLESEGQVSESNSASSSDLMPLADRLISDKNSQDHETGTSHSNQPHRCSQCGKFFVRKEGLTRHLKTHAQPAPSRLPEPAETFHCKLCLKDFDTMEKFEHHLSQSHTDLQINSGDHCITNYLEVRHEVKNETNGGLESSNKLRIDEDPDQLSLTDPTTDVASIQKLSTHLKHKDNGVLSARGRRMGKFPCEICGKFYTSLSNVKAHVATHSTNKKFECNVCNKHFGTIYLLKNHLNIHKTKRDLLCSFCGKGFKTKPTLHDHLNLHTKAKTYDCTACDKKCLSHNSLRLHIRVHHTGEKPYKCNVCELRFYTSSKRMDHMRVHTGERPFRCEVCGKNFGDRSSRRRHLKKVHSKFGESSVGETVDSSTFY